RASSRDEFLANLLMPVAKLNFISRSQPIIGPRLRPLTFPANPASEQVAIVAVSATVSSVGIEGTRTVNVIGNVRVNAFNPEIQFVDSRKLGKIESRMP